jgi:hypothetical protein
MVVREVWHWPSERCHSPKIAAPLKKCRVSVDSDRCRGSRRGKNPTFRLSNESRHFLTRSFRVFPTETAFPGSWQSEIGAGKHSDDRLPDTCSRPWDLLGIEWTDFPRMCTPGAKPARRHSFNQGQTLGDIDSARPEVDGDVFSKSGEWAGRWARTAERICRLGVGGVECRCARIRIGSSYRVTRYHLKPQMQGIQKFHQPQTAEPTSHFLRVTAGPS